MEDILSIKIDENKDKMINHIIDVVKITSVESESIDGDTFG